MCCSVRSRVVCEHFYQSCLSRETGQMKLTRSSRLFRDGDFQVQIKFDDFIWNDQIEFQFKTLHICNALVADAVELVLMATLFQLISEKDWVYWRVRSLVPKTENLRLRMSIMLASI